jgi:hypothetical protein
MCHVLESQITYVETRIPHVAYPMENAVCRNIYRHETKHFIRVLSPPTVRSRQPCTKNIKPSYTNLFGLLEPSFNPKVMAVEAGTSPCESYNGQVVLEAFSPKTNLVVIPCASDACSVMGAKQ